MVKEIGFAIRDIAQGELVSLGKDICVKGELDVERDRRCTVEANQRGLFEIRAIVLETAEILRIPDVIAEGEKEALFESDLKDILRGKNLKLDDVHILTREFGKVPAKEKTKYVKILGSVGRTVIGRKEKKKKQ